MPESPEATRARLLEAIQSGNLEEIKRVGRDLLWWDLAEILTSLDNRQLRVMFDALGDEQAAEALAQLDPALAARVLSRLSGEDAADLLEEMPPDEATDVVGELAEEHRERVLRHMQPEESAEVRELLVYPPQTAGGRMTTDFYALHEDMTVDEALRYLRSIREHGEFTSYVYVTDASGLLVGVAPIHELVVSEPERSIREITKRDVLSCPADSDQETCARMLRESGLLALPVTGPMGELVGIVTADDMADVLLEEAGEDIERLGGSQPLEEPYLTASVWHLFRKRVLWLLALFAAEAYTGTVLRAYEQELAAVVALAFFIPLLIGTGGNTGSQTVTMLVRAIAVGEVHLHHIFRVITREVAVAMMLGVCMGIAAYARAWTLGVPELGEVVALTALCIVVWAAFVAAMLPLVLKQLRVDPAVVSAPLITTLVDGTGLIIYFNIAKIVLRL